MILRICNEKIKEKIIDGQNERNVTIDGYNSITNKESNVYYYNIYGELVYITETNGTYQVIEYNQNGLIAGIYSSNGLVLCQE